MKSVRVWLLLLLAMLVPIRGAIAAAMLCPASGTGVQSEIAEVHVAHHALLDAALSEPDRAHADDHGPGFDEHDKGLAAVDKCTVCSTFCSVTPLVSGLPSLPTSADPVGAVYPVLKAPAPEFLSGGPERPPRGS